MAIIEVINVDKIYNNSDVKVSALSNINLTIDKSEFTAIVGPSGSGKTTLLNLMGGLDTPTSGKICIGNVWLNELTGQNSSTSGSTTLVSYSSRIT